MAVESRPSRSEVSKTSKKQKLIFLASFWSFVKKHKIVFAVILVLLIAAITAAILLFSQKPSATKASSEVVAAYEKKLPDLKQEVKSKPTDASARKNYAVALYATGDLKEASKQYQEAIKINDKDAISYNNLGNVYRDLGKTDDAIDAYKKSIERNKKNINVYVNLANVQLYSKDDSAAAISTYKSGLKELPDDSQLMLLLGLAYEKSGDVDQAKKTYESILTKDTENVAAKSNLERLNK